MRQWIYTGVVIVCVVLISCSRDQPKELLETAAFEERQHNVAHAKQLYDDLIRLYPDSQEAETARVRLAAPNQAP